MTVTINIPRLTNLIKAGIYGNKHNVIVIWGELGLGKTTLALQLLEYIYKDWDKVFKHNLFTFHEIKDRIKDAIMRNIRIDAMNWDDLAVYFHRAAIQYMHPDVQDFFSKYNFIRPYLANLFITVPNIEFIPRPLLDFATADIYVQQRGKADFDRSKLIRSFKGRRRSWRKNYDGFAVEWEPLPDEIYARYQESRHAHAVEAFVNPETIFVNQMPKQPPSPL